MALTVWPLQRDADKFYGNPRGKHGLVNPTWKAANLVLVELPYPMLLAWDKSKVIEKAWFHWKCADAFIRCLTKVKQHYVSPKELTAHGLDLFGGTYTYRLMRGGHTLSMHSYGCAMDIDPERNAFGSHSMRMPLEVVKIFEDEGMVWGGHWHKPDGMHFQCARVR